MYVVKLKTNYKLNFDRRKIEAIVQKEAHAILENIRQLLESKGITNKDAFEETLSQVYKDIVKQLYNDTDEIVEDLEDTLNKSLMENVRQEIDIITEKEGDIKGGIFQDYAGPNDFECLTDDIFTKDKVRKIIQKEYEKILDNYFNGFDSEYLVRFKLLDDFKYTASIKAKDILEAIKETIEIETEVNIRKD